MTRIDAIRNRLNSTTVKGKWWVIKGGSKVFVPKGFYKESFYITAEDDSIVGDDGREVLGSSEWIRCEPEDLSFMAHAKSDVEFLLKKVDELQKMLDTENE